MRKYIDADKLWNRLISVSENDWVGFDTIDEVLSGMPAADVEEVRHGRWITLDDEYIDECKCSSCGVLEYFNKGWKRFNYCPNCGSRMDLEGDAE